MALANLLLVAGLAACRAADTLADGRAQAGAQARAVSLLKAGARMHAHDQAMRAEMHRMMDDDDLDLHAIAMQEPGRQGGSLLQAMRNAGTATMDEYVKESEEGLSAALGPRWSAAKIEGDADRSTRALLRSISGPRTLRAISGLFHSGLVYH
mmetsp:Transcript_102281/g.329789  ORF Transcript_102281/g.329789 Transcript_102281/m.329789 type:complete len:153 (+) Transcript_102281:59-517(+)